MAITAGTHVRINESGAEMYVKRTVSGTYYLWCHPDASVEVDPNGTSTVPLTGPYADTEVTVLA